MLKERACDPIPRNQQTQRQWHCPHHKSHQCSWLGFSAAFKHESAFRQELLLCAVLLPFSFVLAQSVSHWAMLIVTLLLLLLVELLNSAIEAITDRVGTEYHVLSGRAKDTASAAVFFGDDDLDCGMGRCGG